MSSPTPAPWSYAGGEVLDAQGNQICQLYDSCRNPSEDDANGALMAAAPLLLKAANEAFTFLGGVDGAVAVRGIILEALLKAEGK